MGEAMSRGQASGRPPRVLLVQCCNLPQWVYVWEQLARLHPDWEIEGLAVDRSDVRDDVQLLLPGRSVHFGDVQDPSRKFDQVVFPLLNRGYVRIRARAWRMGGRRSSVDYSGTLRTLSRAELVRSAFAPLSRPDPSFLEFLARFPHRPLHGRVLLVESASSPSLRAADATLQELLPKEGALVRIGRRGEARRWVDLLRRRFDGAVVFFTGEDRWFFPKLLPFLLRIRRVLIVDESGTVLETRPGSLAGFFLRRLLHGFDWRYRRARILFIQTESREYVRAALEALRRPNLFPGAQVLLLCRQEDRAALAGEPGVAECVALSRRPGPASWWRAWRAIQRFDPEVQCALFTGRPVFRRQKLAYFALAGRFNFAFNARLDGYWLRPSTLGRIFRREPLLFSQLGIAERVLLIQTETPEYMRGALDRLHRPELAPRSEVSLLCRQADRAAFEDLVPPDRLFTYWRGQSVASLWRLRRQLRAREFGVKSAVFTGRPIFRPGKLFFFLAPAESSLVFNARLDAYWLRLRTFRRLFRREPLLFDDHRPGTRLVLFQTEVPDYMRAAHERLLRPDLYPGARVLLFCREEDRHLLSDLPGIEQIRTYGRGTTPGELFRHWRQIRRFRPEVCSAVFTGRPVYRAARLFALLTGFPRLLVLNAGLDAYWLRPWNLGRLFRREPLRFGGEHPTGQNVLFLETEDLEEVRRAVRILDQPHVTPDARITVFCHRSRAAEYLALPNVVRVVTWGEKGSENLRVVTGLLTGRPEVIAAIFSGRRIFLKQKLLFWLIRARHRLAFNRSLDCRYLTWRNLSMLFHNRGSRQSTLSRTGRQIIKGLLFGPRFAYLLVWVFLAERARRRVRNS